MFKRIDHIEIVTDRPARTIAFYTDMLGFKVKARDRIDRSALGVPMDLVYLDLGGTVVELISYEGATVEPAPVNEHLGYRMMAIEVDDMQKTTAHLKAKGVEIVWGPIVREKYARAEICDPNGLPHRIEAVVLMTNAIVVSEFTAASHWAGTLSQRQLTLGRGIVSLLRSG